MNNKKILALILAVLMMLATFAGCRKAGSDDSALLSVNSDVSINYSNVDIVEDNSEPESVVDTTSDIESIPTVNNNNSSTENTVSVEEPNTNTNPDGVEIYGSGTSADPYIDTPNADTHTVKTLTIPAGKSVFYSIYRVGGRILTINDTNAFVVCDGTKHSAQGGKVSFKVVDALASDAVTFEIGNTGADASFTLVFTIFENFSCSSSETFFTCLITSFIPFPLAESVITAGIPCLEKYVTQFFVSFSSAKSLLFRTTTLFLFFEYPFTSGFWLDIGILASTISTITSINFKSCIICFLVLAIWPGYQFILIFPCSPIFYNHVLCYHIFQKVSNHFYKSIPHITIQHFCLLSSQNLRIM